MVLLRETINVLYYSVPYRIISSYRTVQYHTVRYGTHTVNGNICHKRESNLRHHRLTPQMVKKSRTEKVLGKSVGMDDSNTFGQKCWSRPSQHFFSNTFWQSVERKCHVKDELDVFPYDLYESVYIILRESAM